MIPLFVFLFVSALDLRENKLERHKELLIVEFDSLERE